MQFLSKFNTPKPADKPSSKAVETSNQQVRRLLREIHIDKLDLYDLVQTEEYLPVQFLVFVNKYWEKGTGRELIVKYLSTLRQDTSLSQEQKESAYLAIVKFLKALEAQNRRSQEAKRKLSLEGDKEKTARFVCYKLKESPAQDNRTQVFLDWLQLTFSASSNKRLFNWVQNQEIKALRMDDWYKRARNLLLLSEDRSGVIWLDRQMLFYLQNKGEGLETK